MSYFAPYSLVAATSTTLGGVKVSGSLTIAGDGTLSLTAANITGALGYTPLSAANNLSELNATAATARTNLGLGAMATQAPGAVAITGGSISGVSINAPTRVITGTGTVTMVSTDVGGAIVINKTTGAATAVSLMAAPATGAMVTIKDGKGDAATNNITITPAAGTIDGAATLVMAQAYESVTLLYNGTQWNIV